MRAFIITFIIAFAVVHVGRAQNFIMDVHINTEGEYLFTESAWKVETFLYKGFFKTKINRLNITEDLKSDERKLDNIEKAFQWVEAKDFLDSEGGLLQTSTSEKSGEKLALYRYYVTYTKDKKVEVQFLLKVVFSGTDSNIEMRKPVIEDIEILKSKGEFFNEFEAVQLYLERLEKIRGEEPPPPPPGINE